eukprot:2988400-Amphidinium_carterae.1
MQANTETAWMKRRRQSVDQAVAKTGAATSMAALTQTVMDAALNADAWTESHEKMAQKQVSKGKKRQLDAIMEGVLPEPDVEDEGMAASVAAAKKKRMSNARETYNHAARIISHTTKKNPFQINQHSVVWLEESCRTDDM